jgi:hypothetical protein
LDQCFVQPATIFEGFVMTNRGRKGHIIDVGEPDSDDGMVNLSDYIPVAQRNTLSEGLPLETWLIRSCEELPAVDKPLTYMISSGNRRS